MTICRSIGGAILTDYGRIDLALARSLVAFYAEEAGWLRTSGKSEAALICEARARSFSKAVAHANDWRSAAGWVHPDEADNVCWANVRGS